MVKINLIILIVFSLLLTGCAKWFNAPINWIGNPNATGVTPSSSQTYLKILSVSNSSFIGGGDIVSISGANFSSSTLVYINGSLCLNSSVVSSTVIRCVTSALPAGSYTVSLSDSGQTSQIANGISYKIDFFQNLLTLSGLSTAGFNDGDVNSAQYSYISGLVSAFGNFYALDQGNYAVRKLDLSTQLASTVAGGNLGFNDGAGLIASFTGSSYGATFDGTYIYVGDHHTIRTIDSSYNVVTIVGAFNHFVTADNTGVLAGIQFISGICTDNTNLYFTDNQKVRKVVIGTNVVTSYAPNFGLVTGITIVGNSLYFADGNLIRTMDKTTGVASVFVGTGVPGYIDGPGALAEFNSIEGLTTDGTNLYVADYSNNLVRKVNIATQVVSTVVGSTASGVDHDGTLATATVFQPISIDYISTGSHPGLYVGNGTSVKKLF